MTPTADQAQQVDYLRVGPVTHLRIRGSIDERFVLERPGRELGGNVVLDLGQVELTPRSSPGPFRAPQPAPCVG